MPYFEGDRGVCSISARRKNKIRLDGFSNFDTEQNCRSHWTDGHQIKEMKNGKCCGFCRWIWANDGAKSGTVDTFRIQILDNTGATVYDNGVNQSLGGGNIMVQTPKK